MTSSAKVVLVTGAGSGFGKLTAETLVRRGMRVFAGFRDPNGRDAATARALGSVASVSGGAFEAVSLDISRDDSVAAAAAFVGERATRVDVVVNNAGISAMGLNEGFTSSQALQLLDVNVLGAHRVNRAFLPLMKPHKAGLLVHISTGLARMTLPCFGLYSASKAALEAIAESYRYELSVLGIDSVIVEPGVYPTNLGASALAPADKERLVDYGPLAQLPERMMHGMAAMFSGHNAPNPQEVPDAILRLIEMPDGERPLRTTVGGGGGALDELNGLTDRIQAQIMGAQGMGALLHVPKR